MAALIAIRGVGGQACDLFYLGSVQHTEHTLLRQAPSVALPRVPFQPHRFPVLAENVRSTQERINIHAWI